jgi:hypothetical protein
MGGGVGDYPYFIQVSRGLVDGHKRLFKFGHNPVIQDISETIWDAGGLYTYPSSAVAMTVTSGAGATDNGVAITVQGLDSNYNEVSEEVTLASTGTATTTQTFLRVYRAFVSGSQAITANTTIANGGTTYAQINTGENQTLMALWTVPAGYTAYLLDTKITAFTEQNNKVATINIYARIENGVFRTADKFDVFAAAITQNYKCPIPFPEKTDIEVRAVATSSNADLRVAAGLDIIYIANTAP